jgi:hypothetical protein
MGKTSETFVRTQPPAVEEKDAESGQLAHPRSIAVQDGAQLPPPRKQQLSVKITEDACTRFRRLAHERGVTLGALFEQAVELLDQGTPARAPAALAAAPSSQPLRYRFGRSNFGLF